MGRKRKGVENIEQLTTNNYKKYVRYEEGAELFSMGLNSFKKLAHEAGAIRRLKRMVLVNVQKIEEYIELFDDGEGFF